MPRSGKRVYEGKNDNDAPLLPYAGPTLVDSRILCRMRAVRGDSDSLAGKYRSAGRMSDGRCQMGWVPGRRREKRFLRLTGLSPRGFLGLTAAASLRVVVSPDGDEYICRLRQRKPYNRPGGRGKTSEPPCGRWKCTSFGTFGTTFPRWEACHWILSRLSAPCESSSFATPEGELLAMLCLEMLMRTKAEWRANLPLRGGKRT